MSVRAASNTNFKNPRISLTMRGNFLTMINERYAKEYCCEDISKIENYGKAIADNTQTWEIHHRREISENKSRKQLKAENLYDNRPADELIFLTCAEHNRLHAKYLSEESKQKNRIAHLGKRHTETTKQKMSESKRGENNPMYGSLGGMYGKQHSAETCRKISEA